MLRRIRDRLTYANVVASMALFIALGGVSYAAVTLPRNSVGTTQIKPNAVNASKVKDGSLTGKDVKDRSLSAKDFSGSVQGAAGAQGPQGAAGAAGAAGTAGATGPTGPQGVPGAKGDTGAPGSLADGDLPSGVTARGSYAVSYPDGNWAGSNPAWTGISYGGFRLPSDPTVVIVAQGATPTGCTGTIELPTADPGYLCIYRGFEVGFGPPSANRQANGGFSTTGANRTGVFLSFGLSGTTLHLARGTWAVTAQ